MSNLRPLNLIFPAEHDRFGIDFFQILLNPSLELGQGMHPDAPQKGTRHLAEEDLNEIEPRAVCRRKNKLKAVWDAWPGKTEFLSNYERSDCRPPGGPSSRPHRWCPGVGAAR